MTGKERDSSDQGTSLSMSAVKRTKGSQWESGMMYQYALTTLIAGKLSKDDNVENYILYSSESSAGKFDDILGRVRLKNPNDNYVCLIRVKSKIDSNKEVHLGDLTTYVDNMTQIVENSSVECRKRIVNDNIRFSFVTNSSALRYKKNSQYNLISSENNGINKTLLPFKGNPLKLVTAKYHNFSHLFHIFVNQPDYEEVTKDIRTICEIDDANDVIAYVRDYYFDDSLYQQGLSKEQFEIELLKIRFAKSVISLSQPAELINDELLNVWNRIISENDITIVSNDNDMNIETCLLSCWAQHVISLLELDINRNKLIRIESLDDNIRAKFEAYTNRKGHRFWLQIPENFKSLLIELWKYGEIPLVLKSDSKLNKYTHLRRKYVIVNDFSKRTEELNQDNFVGVNLFRNLGDLNDRHLKDLLQNVRVSLQGRKPTTLNTLIGDDIEALKTFTCADMIGFMKKRIPQVKKCYLNSTDHIAFLIEDANRPDDTSFEENTKRGGNIKITCNSNDIPNLIETYKNYTVCYLRRNHKLEVVQGDKSTLRNCFNDKNGDPLYYSDEGEFIPVIGVPVLLERNYYIRRCLRRATIPSSYFRDHERHVCLVSGDYNSVEDLKFVEVDINTDEIKLFGKENNIKVNESTRDMYWNKLSALKCPLLEVIIKEGKMELIRYKHCKNLSNYITYEGRCLKEEEFFKEIVSERDKIAVITGEPGMGKSSLLKSFCTSNDTQNYILFYDLKNLQTDLSQNKNLLNDPIKYIFHRENSTQFADFLRHLYEKRKLVLLLDSIDEIISAYQEDAIKLIRAIARNGIQIIIASRSIGCDVLMRNFDVRVAKIEFLNNEDVEEFLTKWTLDKHELTQIPDELKTNPLFLDFLRVVAEDSEQLKNINQFKFYEKVLDMKIRSYFERNNKIFCKVDVQDVIELHQRYALTLVFGEEEIARELKWRRDGKQTNDTKFGIITSFDDAGRPNFYHHTFVEFLVAQWLANAVTNEVFKDTVKRMYRQLWQENKMDVLDIHSARFKPHQTVLQLDVRAIERLYCQSDCYPCHISDKFGRTALHFATIRCKYSSNSYAAYKILDIIIQSMQRSGHELNKADNIMGWKWIDYLDDNILHRALMYKLKGIVMSCLNCIRLDGTSNLFPLSKFPMVFKGAVNLCSIEIIRDLLLFQNRENNKFDQFYKACTASRLDGSVSWCDDLEIEGDLTPLHLACIYSSKEIVHHLIRKGCSVNVVDNFGCTPLFYILCALKYTNDAKECIDIVTMILNQEDVHAKDEGWDTLLHIAVQTRNSKIVKKILDAVLATNSINMRKLIHGRDSNGDAPLHLAIEMGNLEIVEMLLEKEADVNLPNKDGETPFWLALVENNFEIIKKMLARNVDLNFQNVYTKKTYLHYAVGKQNLGSLQLLLENGANLNIQDAYAETPLHTAVKVLNMDIVGKLIQKGAKVFIENMYGKTPLDYAIAAQNVEICRLILNSDTDGIFSIHNAVMARNFKLVEYLLNNGEDPNAKSNDNSSGIETIYRSIQKFTTNTSIISNILDNIRPLHLTVHHDDLDIAQLLIQKGAQINLANDKDETPLHYAVKYNNIEIATLLLDNGAKVDSENYLKETPLNGCVNQKRLDIMKLLLKHNANVNHEAVNNNTPLHYAAICGETECARVLLENGANPRIINKNKQLPLHFAALGKSLDTLKLLLDCDINVNFQDIYKKTPLHYAVVEKKFEFCELLLEKGGEANLQDEDGKTSLHFSVEQKDIKIVHLLVEKGANVNVSDKQGRTPLHYLANTPPPVALNDIITITRFLLNSQAGVNLKDIELRTPLHYASSNGYAEIVKLLLENNAEINIKDNNGWTPLHVASMNKYVSICGYLLDGGAEVNAQDNQEKTALHYAASNIDIDTIKLLLEKGAIINVKDNKPATPPNYVLFKLNEIPPFKVKNLRDILGLFLKNGADLSLHYMNFETLLYCVILSGDTSYIPLLVERYQENGISISKGDNNEILRQLIRKEINVQDKNQLTFLHIIVRYGSFDITRCLLELGADANLQDMDGRTPLHYSSQRDDAELMELLLRNRANVNIQDYQGKTPLHYFVKKERIDLVKLLLSHGANPNIEDISRRTPLYYQRKGENMDLIWLLTKNGANVDFQDEDEDGKAPLHYAALNKNPDFGRLLLQAKADVNNQDYLKCTPLHYAVFLNDANFVRFLAYSSTKLDVNIQDNNGETPLHYSMKKNRIDFVDLLLRKGGDISIRDKYGRTPLYYVGKTKNTNLAKVLVEYAAQFNFRSGNGNFYKLLLQSQEEYIKDNNRKTPFNDSTSEAGLAVIKLPLINEPNLDMDIIRLLTENSANVNVQSVCKRTFFAQASLQEIVFQVEEKQVFLHSSLTSNNLVSLPVLNVNTRDKYSKIFLDYAMKENNIDLTKRGANSDVRDKSDRSLLHYVRFRQHMAILKLLIGNTKDVNARNKNGITPLHFAAIDGNLDFGRLLVEANADVNLQDKAECTPLHYATSEWNYDYVKLLLEKNAAVHIEDKNKKTALWYAINRGDTDISSLFLENNANVNLRDSNLSTPLHHSVNVGNYSLVSLLLDKKADTNVLDISGKTPLHHALELKDTYLVKFLLENGANVNLFDGSMISPIHYAFFTKTDEEGQRTTEENKSRSRYYDLMARILFKELPIDTAADSYLIRLLLQHQVDVNVRDKHGRTIIHYAAVQQNTDILKLLLDKRIDINVVDFNNKTPLHYAVEGMSTKTTKMLINNGALINNADLYKRTPLHYAVSNDVPDPDEVNYSQFTGYFKEFVKKIMWKSLLLINLLLENGADINRQDCDLATPLHCAIPSKNIDVVKKLLAKHPNVDLKDKNGETALHYVVRTQGKTRRPIRYPPKGTYINILRMLLEYGANVHLQDNNFKTPLYYALKSRNVDFVELFLRYGATNLG